MLRMPVRPGTMPRRRGSRGAKRTARDGESAPRPDGAGLSLSKRTDPRVPLPGEPARRATMPSGSGEKAPVGEAPESGPATAPPPAPPPTPRAWNGVGSPAGRKCGYGRYVDGKATCTGDVNEVT
jgi:hypothetical protein